MESIREQERKKEEKQFAVAMLLGWLVLLLCIMIRGNAANPKNYTIETVVVTVQQGDTLYDLSIEYKGDYPGPLNEYMYNTAQENGIDNVNNIRIGDTIKFKTYSRK